MLNNKTILITGGTGSFGHAFLEFLLKTYRAKKIIIFSRDEYKQYKMMQKYPPDKFDKIRFFLGDVRDKERLKMAMNGVDYVIHAAALKQVSAAEYNPMEFIKTNIYGAENVVQCSIEQKVEKVIALSTDKAANPINLYGATKLASDKIFISGNNIKGKNKTTFSVVRYGNVLGSRGSILPLFLEILKNKGKYFPITDKRMTRFFITLQQSVEFVNYCLKHSLGGEIFVPKIPSIKITDLAKALSAKIKLKEIGIRPGEKIHEVMCSKETANNTIELKNCFIILQNDPTKKFLIKFNKLFKNQKIKKVKEKFEYSSNNNTFLKISEIKKLIQFNFNDTL